MESGVLPVRVRVKVKQEFADIMRCSEGTKTLDWDPNL
jgi:hypothetical protein